MIRVRLQIGDGDILDTFEGWGFIYMDADERTEAPIKKREVSSYAEEAGERTDPRTVQDAFDYKVKFLIECPNRDLENANAKIAAFNKALYTTSYDSNIRTYKEIAFYNDYNRVRIIGLPEPIAQPTDFFRKQDGSALDCAQVELKIRVCDPSKCNFNTILLEDVYDPYTTTDELGVKWYKKNFVIDTIGKARISKPLNIREDLAEFVRTVNGEKVCYYNLTNAKKILKQIATYYGIESIATWCDPIYYMIVLGLCKIDPENYRTVWDAIPGGDWFVRGDVIATYPELGYYKDGEWQPDDVIFAVGEDESVETMPIKNILGDDYDDVNMDNMAIPLKITLPVHPSTPSLLSNVAAPMSLRKIAKAND